MTHPAGRCEEEEREREGPVLVKDLGFRFFGNFRFGFVSLIFNISRRLKQRV